MHFLPEIHFDREIYAQWDSRFWVMDVYPQHRTPDYQKYPVFNTATTTGLLPKGFVCELLIVDVQEHDNCYQHKIDLNKAHAAVRRTPP